MNILHVDKWEFALGYAETMGASRETAEADRQEAGIYGSQFMASQDLSDVEAFAERWEEAGLAYNIPPSFLAAIASRESRVGKLLDYRGMGFDGHAFGVMQVDTRYHGAVKRQGALSLEHIKQAAKILDQYRDELLQKRLTKNWNDGEILRAMAVAYNSGVSNVKTVENMDKGTTNNDYGSDVIARAQYFKPFLKTLHQLKSKK